MFKHIHTLANRLTLSYAAVFAVFLLVAFSIAYIALSTLLDARLVEDLEEDLEELQLAYTDGGLEQCLTEINNELSSGGSSEIFFRISDNDKVIFISDTKAWGDLNDALNKIPVDTYPAQYKLHFDAQEYPTQVIAGHLAASGPLIFIGESTEQNAEILAILLILFVVMFILVLPLAYAAGWWVSQRAVAGINAVSQAAKDIERGNLEQQVIIHDAGFEIQQLGDRFNAMAYRIRQLVHEMRDMIDNIAHDLRSPITRIRATAETLSFNGECKAGAEQVIHECDDLIRLINNTLDVSEAEAGVIQGEMEDVELDQVTHDVCELFEPALEERQLHLDCDLQPVRLAGFKPYLQRVIANLLDNAVKYTPEGGTITVRLQNGGEHVVLTIEDTGIGIPKADVSRVFDRFFRGDQSRQARGSGLGLSFCRAIVNIHHGTIKVDSEEGKGSRFTLAFPSLGNL